MLPCPECLARLWPFVVVVGHKLQKLGNSTQARAEYGAKMTANERTFLRSSLQLLAALMAGAFNSLACLFFLTPPITLWLAWKHPYIVLPPAVAYYFLRYCVACTAACTAAAPHASTLVHL